MMIVKIKKQKVEKSIVKRKLKFENCNSYLEGTQFYNKTNYLEKN